MTRIRVPLLVWFFVQALLASGVAEALTQKGTLAARESATDVYEVGCTNDGDGAPLSLLAKIRDLRPVAGPRLRVILRKGALGNGIAATSADPIDADSGFGPPIAVNGGEGAYALYVTKTATGVESYQLVVECRTGLGGTGKTTGTALTVLQQQ